MERFAPAPGPQPLTPTPQPPSKNDVRPLRGLRFNEAVVGPLGEVLCPPYDVISPAQQAALHDGNPYNMVRLELGLELVGDTDGRNRYTRAADTLRGWLAEGALREDPTPTLYVYEQTFVHEGRSLARCGVLGRLRLASWEEGVVLPHENTLAKPKADRLALMRATACNLSPLFLLFDDPSGTVRELMAVVARAEAATDAYTRDGQRHRLWAARAEVLDRLMAALREPQLYMADGHHRYETALAYRDARRAHPSPRPPSPVGKREDGTAPQDFALVLLVDAQDSGLVVLPTHRLVRGVDPTLFEGLELTLAATFDPESVPTEGRDAPAVAESLLRRMNGGGPGEAALGLFRQGRQAAVLRPRRPGERAPAGGRPPLDVDLLHDLVLAPHLGIGPDELRSGSFVAYARDAAEAVAAVERGAAQAAFLLNPTRVEQVLQTARARGKMPQKSTYFYPKPATGLVINRLT